MFRIRKLTPKECFRLQGFSDENFEAAEKMVSNTQLYKQAGNSIVVDVLYYIFVELYTSMPYLFDDLRLSSFFSGIGAFECALDMLYKGINSENFTCPTREVKSTSGFALGMAMRGRYKEDGIEQVFECNYQQYSNTITTVSKDAMVLQLK